MTSHVIWADPPVKKLGQRITPWALLGEASRRRAQGCNSSYIEEWVFLPFAVETLGGLHQGAVTQVKLLASALARCKGLEEGEVTGQIFGRLSLTLMKANALMISTRRQDADFPLPQLDGIE